MRLGLGNDLTHIQRGWYFSALRFLEFGLVFHQSGDATQSTRPKFNEIGENKT